MAKTGVHEDYFSIIDGRHDVLVEARVERVTEWLVAEPGLVAADSLRVERDVAAGLDEAQNSRVRIFRLPGQSWSQIFCLPPNPTEPFEPFELAGRVSEALEIRSVQIDLSDEGWSGYLFFDHGTAKEASVTCVGCQFQDIAAEFGMPVPEIDEDDEALYNKRDWFHSDLRTKSETPKHPLLGYNGDYEEDLQELATALGFWVDFGEPVWDASCRAERMDLLYDS